MSISGHFLEQVREAPNRSAVAASAVVVDDAGLLLMVRRRRAGSVSYHLPAGTPFPGEKVSTAASRIAVEATGVDVEITGLVGIYSGQDFGVCVRGRPVGGRLRRSEGVEAVWVEPERLDELNLPLTVRRRIEHGLDVGEPFMF